MEWTDVRRWYNQIPRYTRSLLTASTGLSVGAQLGLVHPLFLVVHWPMILRRFQVFNSIDLECLSLLTSGLHPIPV
jgi:hypothetical protein